MIKIINGVYGYMDKDGIVRPKTNDDEPFCLTKKQEERLVGLKVAEYVCVDEYEKVLEDRTGGAWNLDTEQLEELTNAKLKDLAEEMGIDTKKLTTKAKLIEAITSAEVIPGEDEDDGEDAPSFDATEAVQ